MRLQKKLSMKSFKSIIVFSFGLILSACAYWIFCSSSISESDAEMKRVSILCEQLEFKYKKNEFLQMYFLEIRKGLNQYYYSNSSKQMDNEIIVKWWDKLSQIDEGILR